MLSFEAENELGEYSWDVLLDKPHPWLLLLVSLCVVLPWGNLRKVRILVERPCPQVAIVKFDYRWAPFNCSSTVISRKPLGEWHAFAAIDAPAGASGYRIVMARAGDWTARFIDDPPEHVWVKTASISTLSRFAGIFERMLFVATGSGIGPILTTVIGRAKAEPRLAMAVLWVARSPRETFGDALVDELLDLVPEAIIFDTAVLGKPDIVMATYRRPCSSRSKRSSSRRIGRSPST